MNKKLFSLGTRDYYRFKNKFYFTDRETDTAIEVGFDELFFDWLWYKNYALFRSFILIYIRLCVNLIGIDINNIEGEEDLQSIAELYFGEGLELEE